MMQLIERWKQSPRTIRPRQLAVLEACIIGLVSGLAAVWLKQSVGFFGGLRLASTGMIPGWIVLPLIGAIGGFSSGWLIERLAPEASGSGIPQVKVALAGLPTRLNWKLAAVKLLSTLLCLSSGLTLGRQGPTVQIGAAIAAQLSRWLPTSPEHRRQLIAAGAAAGLAAGFNAPIAGVLFVVEELLQEVSGLTLGTAILASFIGAVVSRSLGGQMLTPANLGNIYPRFELEYIPLLLILGGLLGVLSVVFIRGIVLSLKWQQKLMRWGLSWRIGLAGLVTGIVAAMLPAALRDNAGLQAVWHTGEFGWALLVLVFVAKFGLTLMAAGSGAPGGIFSPSLILGSSFGYLFVYAIASIQAFIHIPLGLNPSTDFASIFALAGMAAFFSAVTRGPITAIVIVFEITGDFNLILPLMIAAVTAYWVGEAIASGSIYKYMLAANGIQLSQEASSESKLANLKAADIMQRQVEVLSSQLTIAAAKQAFSSSHHRGFPVVAQGELVGIVTQSDLTRNPLLDDATTTIGQLMSTSPVTVRPHDRLSQVLYLLNRHQISRLPVVDHHKLIGIITRADIIRAESEHLSRDGLKNQPMREPAYMVYQQREPAIGVGQLLVPLSHPLTMAPLLKIAAAIAAQRRYEIVCVQILLIPRHQSPAETPVNTIVSQKLLEQARQVVHDYDEEISVHRQVWVAHDVASVILIMVQDLHIDVLLMGWTGNNTAPGFIFGDVVDTIVRQAACRVMLVKLPPTIALPSQLDTKTTLRFDRWLVPTAGGPNSRQAMQFLPALLNLSHQPFVYLCHVSDRESAHAAISDVLDPAVKLLQSRVDTPIQPIMIDQGDSITQSIVELARSRDCDVILIGATRLGLLQQVVQGNIPEAIARSSNCTVILVRDVMS
jgi:chloride channel protein, CIC family